MNNVFRVTTVSIATVSLLISAIMFLRGDPDWTIPYSISLCQGFSLAIHDTLRLLVKVN